MNADHKPVGLDRREFVAALAASLPDALIIAGLGSPAYDLFAAGDKSTNFYLWGAMGGASALGLGLALAQPRRPVVVLTGDGEMMMGIGTLATIAVGNPANLTIVVLDNGHYGETGMQASHTSLGTDLVALASGFGIRCALQVSELADAPRVAEHARALAGPVFVRVRIREQNVPRALPPRDGVALKIRFRAALGFDEH